MAIDQITVQCVTYEILKKIIKKIKLLSLKIHSHVHPKHCILLPI